LSLALVPFRMVILDPWNFEMFGQNPQKSLVRSATHRPLIDPHFKIVLTDPDHARFSGVRSHVDPDQDVFEPLRFPIGKDKDQSNSYFAEGRL
jgi:hypothetical protein